MSCGGPYGGIWLRTQAGVEAGPEVITVIHWVWVGCQLTVGEFQPVIEAERLAGCDADALPPMRIGHCGGVARVKVGGAAAPPLDHAISSSIAAAEAGRGGVHSRGSVD